MANEFVVRIGDPIYRHYKLEPRTGRPRWTGGKVGRGIELLETWYAWEFFRSWAPRELVEQMKEDGFIRKNREHVLIERARNVYYRDGLFYYTRCQRNTQRVGEYGKFELLSGSLITCRPEYMERYGLVDARIVTVEGRPKQVIVDEDEFVVSDESWPVMESFLGLDQAYKRVRRVRSVA